MVLSENLKKIILAGIGTIASTAEKSKELIDEMAKKGEITVDQAKILNGEFASNLKNASQDLKAKSKDFRQDLKETIKKKTAKEPQDVDFSEFIAGLSPDQIDALKEEIVAYEEAADQAMSFAEDEPADVPEEEAEASEEALEEAAEEEAEEAPEAADEDLAEECAPSADAACDMAEEEA